MTYRVRCKRAYRRRGLPRGWVKDREERTALLGKKYIGPGLTAIEEARLACLSKRMNAAIPCVTHDELVRVIAEFKAVCADFQRRWPLTVDCEFVDTSSAVPLRKIDQVVIEESE